MAPAARPWFVGASLLAHALPLLLLLRAAPPEPAPGATDAGTGGIEVALGPAGGAVGASAPERPFEEVAPVEPLPTATPPAPEPQQAAAEPPPEPEAPPPEPVAEPPPPEPVTAPPEPVVAAPPPETVTKADEPLPEVAAAPEPETAPARAPAPRPLRRPPMRVAAAEPARGSPRTVPAAPAPPPPGEQGRGGSDATAAAGEAQVRSGGGTPGAPADYFTALQAWLERHKEYPRQARLRRQEGTVLLSFTFDRDGRVLDHRIERSSGHPTLDREVAAMLDRAQPLPPIPEGVAQARLAVTVPVQFALR